MLAFLLAASPLRANIWRETPQWIEGRGGLCGTKEETGKQTAIRFFSVDKSFKSRIHTLDKNMFKICSQVMFVFSSIVR